MAVPFAGTMIRVMSYLFGFIMKKYYTKQKLSSMVKVNISSEHSGITVNCAELPDARAWLQITNLSPFPITVHGIEAELYLSGRVARFVSLSNEEIEPSSEGRLFIQTDLTGRQADHVKRNKGIDNPRLNIKMFLSCRLSKFEIDAREITTKNIEFMNCNNDF
jgi:LEA14-like dessication related protein